MPSLKHHGQMSEAFITALFLSVSGGLQDVYTYLFRGKVFANAQTGNIVLMSVHAFAGEWGEALRYLVPPEPDYPGRDGRPLPPPGYS